MQDHHRGTGQGAVCWCAPQHRGTKAGIVEAALDLVMLSREATSVHKNLAWFSHIFSPALWPFPTQGCSLQLGIWLCACHISKQISSDTDL